MTTIVAQWGASLLTTDHSCVMGILARLMRNPRVCRSGLCGVANNRYIDRDRERSRERGREGQREATEREESISPSFVSLDEITR